MTGFTFGFYDSLNHDRRYNALQMGSMFDGLISDGVYFNFLDNFKVTANGTGMTVIVKPGRAWFDHTWSLNEKDQVLTVSASDPSLDRIDLVVLEVDERKNGGRVNSLKVIKGSYPTSGGAPVAPIPLNTEFIHQHTLATISVKHGLRAIQAKHITIKVGVDSSCPFVANILRGGTFNAEPWFHQWQTDFEDWFKGVQDVFVGDPLGNLIQMVNNCVKVTDPGAGSVGDIRLSANDLELKSKGDWIECDGRELRSSSYPKLSAIIGNNERVELSTNLKNNDLTSLSVIPDFKSFIKLDNGVWVSTCSDGGSLAFFDSEMRYTKTRNIFSSGGRNTIKGLAPYGNYVIMLVERYGGSYYHSHVYKYDYSADSWSEYSGSDTGTNFNRLNVKEYEFKSWARYGSYLYMFGVYENYYNRSDHNDEQDYILECFRVSGTTSSSSSPNIHYATCRIYTENYDSDEGYTHDGYLHVSGPILIGDTFYFKGADWGNNSRPGSPLTVTKNALDAALDSSIPADDKHGSFSYTEVPESNTTVYNIFKTYHGAMRSSQDGKIILYGIDSSESAHIYIITGSSLSGAKKIEFSRNETELKDLTFCEDTSNIYLIRWNKSTGNIVVEGYNKISGKKLDIANPEIKDLGYKVMAMPTVDRGDHNSGTVGDKVSYLTGRVACQYNPKAIASINSDTGVLSSATEAHSHSGTLSAIASTTFKNLTLTAGGDGAKAYIRAR